MRGACDSDPFSGAHDPNGILRGALEEKPIWRCLYESLRDAFFPAKLPPLVLTSVAIEVPDRMAARTSPWAVGTATLVNGGILALLLLLGLRTATPPQPKPVPDTGVRLRDFMAPFEGRGVRGGDGSGTVMPSAPSQERLPRFENTPLLPPQIPLLDRPKLPVEPSVAMQQPIHLPESPSLPSLGEHNAVSVTLAPNGPAVDGSYGLGLDSGAGPGKGNNFGPGDSPGAGNGIYVPGGDVSAPIPIVTPQAEFSDEARRAKFQGICVIALIVDAEGNPQNPRVVRRLGMGLDEKAMEAVLRYRFKPARKAGKPVPVWVTVAVNFRLY
jgi:periplasmic protein TonB